MVKTSPEQLATKKMRKDIQKLAEILFDTKKGVL